MNNSKDQIGIFGLEVDVTNGGYDDIYDELLINKNKYKRRRRRRMGSRSPKVFVVNRGTHDFSSAEKYGELVYLTEELQVKLSAPAVYRMFTEILCEQSCPTDYILWTGLAFLNGIATSVFKDLHGRVNALIYNRAANSYTAMTMKLPEHIVAKAHENALAQHCTTT